MYLRELELPQYQCHKKVHALKIKLISFVDGPDLFRCELIFEDARHGNLPVTKEWLTKHKPEGGGYLVVYEDGYASYSPAVAFENGYTLIEQ